MPTSSFLLILCHHATAGHEFELVWWFVATMGLIQAYLIELSAHNPSLLKARQSYLMAANLAMPMVLAPIGQ